MAVTLFSNQTMMLNVQISGLVCSLVECTATASSISRDGDKVTLGQVTITGKAYQTSQYASTDRYITFRIAATNNGANPNTGTPSVMKSRSIVFNYSYSAALSFDVTTDQLIIPVARNLTTHTIYVQAFVAGTTGANGTIIPVSITFPKGPIVYGSVNGKTKMIKKMYGSVNGQTKEIKKLYGSVNGVTKRIY